MMLCVKRNKKNVDNKKKKAVKYYKASYFANIIANYSPRELFTVINRHICPCTKLILTPSLTTCNLFAKFFIEKMYGIRANILTSVVNLGETDATELCFNQFETVSLSEVHDIISHLKRSIFPNDSVSLRILKDGSDIVGPSILSIINSSLYNGIVPVCLKQAIIEPILKKGNLDGYDLSNYRPTSKLPILSKILEKVVLRQLTTFLTKNNILVKFQPGFRCRHSTESALLQVVNDLLLISDAGNHAALILLDLSAAFDTIDHSILLNRLKHFVGVQGTVYKWFAFYLEQRSFTVKLGNCFSYSAHSTSGVPQRSIMGPVLFALYMLPLGRIFKNMVFLITYMQTTHRYICP